MDHSLDECIWCFNSNDTITITEDMELFKYLTSLMNQQYTFSTEQILRSYKNEEITVIFYLLDNNFQLIITYLCSGH